LELDRIGATRRGSLVFEVPTDEFKAFHLRFYDYAHGHWQLGLVEGREPTNEKTTSTGDRNEILDLEIHGEVRKGKEIGRSKAPEGLCYLVVELRGSSRFETEVDATAFDPKAEKGAKTRVGTVADWQDTHRYIQLVVDGEYGYAPTTGTTLPNAPRFLPDIRTGGSVVFLVPEKYESLHLRCEFPNAATPEGETIHPKAIVLGLGGTPPERPERKAIAQIDDDLFQVSVVEQNLVREFAGMHVGEKGQFLILDVTVANVGEQGEFFETKKQLHYATETGAQRGMDPVTFLGLRYPSESVWVPPNERRRFQIVFRLSLTEKSHRLSYSGISKAEVVELRSEGSLPPENKSVCPKCKESVGPDDLYCERCGTKIDR